MFSDDPVYFYQTWGPIMWPITWFISSCDPKSYILKNGDLRKISIFWNFYYNFMVLKNEKKFARNSNLNSEYFSSFRCKVRGRKNASGKYEIWLWLRISPNAHRSMFNSHIRFQTGFLSDFSEHFKKFAENVRVPVNINEYGWTPTGKFRKLSF